MIAPEFQFGVGEGNLQRLFVMSTDAAVVAELTS